MKTQVAISYQTNLDDLCFGYWEPVGDFDGKVTYLKEETPEAVEKAAKYLECSPKLVDALVMLASDVQEKVRNDMIDIWRRLDKIEQELNRR